jgi:hypothetical protein
MCMHSIYRTSASILGFCLKRRFLPLIRVLRQARDEGLFRIAANENSGGGARSSRHKSSLRASVSLRAT